MAYDVYPSGDIEVKLKRGIMLFDKKSGHNFFVKKPKTIGEGRDLTGIIRSVDIGEMVLTKGTVVKGNIKEYITDTIPTNSVPNRAMIVADYKGDVTFYLSRDGGTTWTEATPNLWTDLSSQPGGDSQSGGNTILLQDDFSTETGLWTVETGTVIINNGVCEFQEASSFISGGSLTWDNYTVQAKFKVTGSEAIFGVKNHWPPNLTVIFLRINSGIISVEKYVNGNNNVLWWNNTSLSDIYYTFKIVCSGTTYSFYVTGGDYINETWLTTREITDPEFATGKLLFGSTESGSVFMNDVLVTSNSSGLESGLKAKAVLNGEKAKLKKINIIF